MNCMNNLLLITVAVILIVVVIAIVVQNRKDEKEFEDQLKQDFPKKRTSDTDEGEKQSV